MIKILVIGLDDAVNGVNEYIVSFLEKINIKNVQIDLLVINKINSLYENRIKKINVIKNIYYVDIFRKNIIKSIKKIYSFHKMNQYDIYYCNISVSEMYIYSLFAKKFSKNSKIIIHSHNSNVDSLLFKICHYLFRIYMIKKSDYYLACSYNAAKFMFGKKMFNKVTIINNGIDLNKYKFSKEIRQKIRKEYNLKENEVLIGHVGRFEKQKNHKMIIEIFRLYKKINNNAKLILIGDGTLKHTIINKIKEYNLEDNIIVLDKSSKVNEIYQAMDIFILPSLWEGLPIVGIEALASGLYCLFSNKISKEIMMSNNSILLPLKERIWVSEINNYFSKKNYNNNRESIIEIVKNAGFDINDNYNKVISIMMNNN